MICKADYTSNNSDWGSSAGQMSVFVNSGAYLDLRVGNVVIDKLTGTGHVGTTWSSTGKILRIGNNDGSSTFDGVIENTITGSSFTNFTGGGNVGLTKNGSGTQILTGANTYTFTTNISGGTLQLGDGGTSGSLATGSMIVNNGTLAFNRSDSISQGTHFSDNTISGSGGLTQMGPGSLTLTTNHSYTGTTAVTGGELAIALAPGTKWNVAKLDLANATTLSLHNFDSSSGTASADVSQSLTTTGTVTVKVSGHFTVGSFPLIWYPVGSSIGGAGFGALVLGALPAGVSATLVHDPDNGTINLNVTAVQSDPFQDWITTHYPSLSGNNALPGADPDGDRMSNLGEFAFNGDPTNGTNNGLIAVKSVDTNANGNKELTLTLAVRTGAAFTGSPSPSATMDGVSYRIEGSLNLVDAFASAVSEVLPALTPTQTGLPDISGSGWEYHSFRLNTSEGLTGKGFLRAKAATP